jgi:hypothetical protein
VDELFMPVPEAIEQDAQPWCNAIAELISDTDQYLRVSAASRNAALEYVKQITLMPFVNGLQHIHNQ